MISFPGKVPARFLCTFQVIHSEKTTYAWRESGKGERRLEQGTGGMELRIRGNRCAVADGCDGIVEYWRRTGDFTVGKIDGADRWKKASSQTIDCQFRGGGRNDRASGLPLWETRRGGRVMTERLRALSHRMGGVRNPREPRPVSERGSPIWLGKFWGFRREGELAVVRGRAREYKKLRPMARRCGVKLRIRSKGGSFPFWLSGWATGKG